MEVIPHLPLVEGVGVTLNLKLIAFAVPTVGQRANPYMSSVPIAAHLDVSHTPSPVDPSSLTHVAGEPAPSIVLE